MSISLPNLNHYKEVFTKKEVVFPVSTVVYKETGLLRELPSPPPGKSGWPWTVEASPAPIVMESGESWPKISIVIPSYNQGEFIEEAIRSVLLQNYPNLEFIIMDGDSTDKTREIIEKYSSWLSFWQSKEDRGQGHAINMGFSVASGDYLGWLNSDDFYLPKCLREVAINALDTSAQVIYGDAVTLYDDDSKACYCYGNLVLDRYLRFGCIIYSHAVFWSQAVHVPICETLKCAIDYELWLRLVPSRTRSYINKPLGVFRLQPNSKSCNDLYQRLWKQDHEKIIEAYGEEPKSRSLLRYEFRLVQRIHKQLRKKIIIKDFQEFLLQDSA